MHEFMEPNQCDVRCPRRAFMTGEYRVDTANAGSFKKVLLASELGACLIGQMFRAGTCPQRNLPPRTWQPREECADAVREALSDRPLDVVSMTDHERQTLAPYTDQSPPTPEQ